MESRMDRFVDFVDNTREATIRTHEMIKAKTIYGSKYAYDKCWNNKGMFILVVTLIATLATGMYYVVPLWGTVLYLLLLATNIFNYKKEKDAIDDIDISTFNKLDAVLDNYIQNCYTRDVGFYRPKSNDYITEKEQNKELGELLDSVAKNISPSMREKLERYYGKHNVDSILARKCLVFISLLAANNNKNIYTTEIGKMRNYNMF